MMSQDGQVEEGMARGRRSEEAWRIRVVLGRVPNQRRSRRSFYAAEKKRKGARRICARRRNTFGLTLLLLL